MRLLVNTDLQGPPRRSKFHPAPTLRWYGNQSLLEHREAASRRVAPRRCIYAPAPNRRRRRSSKWIQRLMLLAVSRYEGASITLFSVFGREGSILFRAFSAPALSISRWVPVPCETLRRQSTGKSTSTFSVPGKQYRCHECRSLKGQIRRTPLSSWADKAALFIRRFHFSAAVPFLTPKQVDVTFSAAAPQVPAASIQRSRIYTSRPRRASAASSSTARRHRSRAKR